MNITQNEKKFIVFCPECNTVLPYHDKINQGMILECPACGIESEIIEVNPVKLSPLEEEK